MPNDSQALSVKSLNDGPGKNRYRFKTAYDKIKDIDLKVIFRGLDAIQPEPSKDSTFFLDSLMHWRELNTTEGFISFYDEMLPVVQTLPLILLLKEKIFTELLKRIDLKFRLSLEPILGLFAALSRDIPNEFILFLNRLIDSLLSLLQNGGQDDPEILQQVFTYWSYILINLQKYLDVVQLLKITRHLRYYPKDHIQNLMAESISFLMKKAPCKQVQKGVMNVMNEVKKNPTREAGATSLLYYIMRGTCSTLHSRANYVIDLLFSSSMIGAQGSETALPVLCNVLQRLFKDLGHNDLKIIWNSLLEKIMSIICVDECLVYMNHLLLVLISTFEDSSRLRDCVEDYKPFLEHVKTLIERYIPLSSSSESEEHSIIVDRTLKLMLNLLDVRCISSNKSVMSTILLQWAPVFMMKTSSLFGFLNSLLLKESHVVHFFYGYILSSMNHLIDYNPEGTLHLLLTFYERHIFPESGNSMDVIPEVNVSRICSFFDKTIHNVNQLIKTISTENKKSHREHLNSDLVVLWAIFRCYSIFQNKLECHMLMKETIDYVCQLLAVETDLICGIPRSTWQGILGAALCSYHKVILNNEIKNELLEAKYFLHIAEVNKSSPHVLISVADFLDDVLGLTNESKPTKRFLELNADQVVHAVSLYSDNMAVSKKLIRVSTLRILSHFSSLDYKFDTSDERPLKKLKGDRPSDNAEFQCCNVFELLHSIETQCSVKSKSNNIFISMIMSGLTAGKINRHYVPVLTNAIVGLFYIRLSHVQKSAMECLTFLIDEYKELAWDKYFQCLENLQTSFLTSNNYLATKMSDCHGTSDLGGCFDSYLDSEDDPTPHFDVLCLVLKSLQKVKYISHSYSQQLIKSFLRFLGYSDDNSNSGQSFSFHCCRKADWEKVLVEWLDLLKLMHLQSSHHSQFLKDVLSNRLLELDSTVQMKVLDCLLHWKDDFLMPYEQHLRHLINLNDMREELTIWNISKESKSIQENHRVSLIPLIIRILVPKVRKIKKLASHKHAGALRKAILSFIVQLDIDELSLFFSLLFNPLLSTSHGSQTSDFQFKIFYKGFQSSILRQCSTVLKVDQLSCRKISGFLHVAEDVLRTFDEPHLKPFLNVLLIIIVRILECCSLNLMNAKGDGSSTHEDPLIKSSMSNATSTFNLNNASIKQSKDLRSLCLRMISFVLDKFEDFNFSREFWNVFFLSVKPLIQRFKQESSSSEKPSSLLACFVSISRNPELVSLLDRDELIPTIFSILTVKTSSDAVVHCVFKFVENLLNLDMEGNHLVNSFLARHIDTLIFSLNELFQHRKETQRKMLICPRKTEIGLLKQLSSYLNNCSAAKKFVDMMLPLFMKKGLTSDECLEGLEVIKRTIPFMDITTTREILKVIYLLLLSAESNIRLSICDIVRDLAAIDSSLDLLAKLLSELNAISVTELDEVDYDTRIRAYNKIESNLFHQLYDEQALIIMSHCVYDISSEDLIVRQSASSALISFIDFSSKILGLKAQPCDGSSGVSIENLNIEHANSCTWTNSKIKRIIKKIFLENVGQAMGKGVSAQKEWIFLLREMVLKVPGLFGLNSLGSLCSDDPEVDFFNNILHLQIHKRITALSHFKNVLNTGKVSESLLVKIFVPLFFNMMFDVKDGKGEHQRNVFLESLACISGQLRWEAYFHFLTRCFREMALKPHKQKFLLRLICSVLDMFHFFQTEPGMDSGISEKLISPDKHKSLEKTILPRILSLFNSGSESLNITVSLVTLKLLKLLSKESMELHLPNIIRRICNFLKDRMQSNRDEARLALVMCLNELGPAYLQMIVKVLMATLKRGFELHVLGYTLNFILSKSFAHPIAGSLDYCLDDLLLIALNDILGDVAKEKDVVKIASKMKETQKRMSFETIKLISQSISFKTHAKKMLATIEVHLSRQVMAKEKSKIGNILHHIMSGFKHNPSVDMKDALVFVYGLIKDGMPLNILNQKKSSADKMNKESVQELEGNGNISGLVGHQFQHSHLIIVFALEVLDNCLKNMKLSGDDPQTLPMLDPFLELLGKCLTLKYEDVLSATFKCLSVLLRLPIPSIDIYADKIKILVMDIAHNTPHSNSPLVESSLRLLTVLLTRISLSSNQLHMLIQFPLFIDLETNPSPIALSLLKQIISRKLEATEIYDIISKVAKLIISSPSEPIRRKCSHIMLKFLLDYPISEKHRQERLDFFLKNLSYVHASGREGALEMLHAILVKFPKREVDAHAQFIYLGLVVCLANEADTKVASMVSMVIKVLINRVGQFALNQIIEFSFSWYKGEKEIFWGASAQENIMTPSQPFSMHYLRRLDIFSAIQLVFALLVETFKDGCQEKVYDLLQISKSIMGKSLHSATNNTPESINAVSLIHKGAFHTLAMLEKMLLQFPWLYSDPNFEGSWDEICSFLLHPYISLRTISSKLIAMCFQKVSLESDKTMFLTRPGILLKIAVSCCNQLRSLTNDSEAVNNIMQNIAYCVCTLHSFVKNEKNTPLHVYWSSLGQHEQNCYMKAFELLGSKKDRDCFLLNSNQLSSTNDLQAVLVVPLIKKLGKIAILLEDNQMKVLFHCYKIMISQIGSEGCDAYGMHIMRLLYRVCEGYAGKVIADEPKHAAEKARDQMRKVMGNEEFLKLYNFIRNAHKQKRDKRKQEERLLEVSNPERNCKRKLQKSAKQRAYKKRKIMGMKAMRWNRR